MISFMIFCNSIEGVESALKLVNDLLAGEGYPAAQVEGRPGSTPPASDKAPVESPTDPADGDAENTEKTSARAAKVCGDANYTS